MPPVAGPDRRRRSPGTTCARSSPGSPSTQDWDFTVGLCAILFLCGYWLGWMAFASTAASSRSSRSSQFLPPMSSTRRTRIRSRSPRRSRSCSRIARDRRRVSRSARRSLGGGADHPARTASARASAAAPPRSPSASPSSRCSSLRLRTPTSRRGSFPTGSASARRRQGSGQARSPAALATHRLQPVGRAGRPAREQATAGHDVHAPTRRRRCTFASRTTRSSSMAAGSRRRPNASADVESLERRASSRGACCRATPTRLTVGSARAGTACQATVASCRRAHRRRQPLVPFAGRSRCGEHARAAHGAVSRRRRRARCSTVDDVHPRPGHRQRQRRFRPTRARLHGNSGPARGCGHELPGVGQAVHGPSGRRQPSARRRSPASRSSGPPGPTDPYDEAIAIQNHLRNPAVLPVHAQSAAGAEQRRSGRSCTS